MDNDLIAKRGRIEIPAFVQQEPLQIARSRAGVRRQQVKGLFSADQRDRLEQRLRLSLGHPGDAAGQVVQQRLTDRSERLSLSESLGRNQLGQTLVNAPTQIHIERTRRLQARGSEQPERTSIPRFRVGAVK